MNVTKEERARDLEVMNQIASKSKLTQKDVDEISEKIKKAMHKQFMEHCQRKNNQKQI